MFKRFTILTLVLLLLGAAGTLVWSQTDCDFSYSNYARAVQLHDMGDYGRALRHYECARLEDPEDAIIPLLIENLHADIANAGSAWSQVGDSVRQPICRRDLDHRQLGEASYNRGDNDEALIHLQCALLQEPTDEAALNLMGRIHIDRGATHAAQHYFDRAEAARKSGSELPNDEQDSARTDELKPPTKFEMPDWLTPYETAPDTWQQRQVQPIVIFSERAGLILQTTYLIVIAEADPLAQPIDARQQARQALKAGDLAGAIDWMLKVAAGADATAADYGFLASLYSMNGDMAGAERSLVQALELAPTRLDLRCRLGIVYVAKGQTEAAFAQFDWVLSVDVANTCANEHRRALNRSLNAAMPVVAPMASPAQATFERGLAMLDARKLFAAANIFMEALTLDPAHLEARCQLGVIMTEWSNYGAALAHFERILAEAPQDACARRNRQVAVLDMLAMYIPLTVDDFFFRARTLADIEAWEPGADAIRRGLELDPTRADMRCELGMIYAQLGDERAALREFDRVLAQDVVDPCAWSNRDALMQRLRDER